MSAYNYLHHSRPARRAIRQMFAMLGDTCHLCGHPGATQADLLVPRAVAPNQPLHPLAFRPAHGGRHPCPTCGRRCNQERGAKPLDQTWSPHIDW